MYNPGIRVSNPGNVDDISSNVLDPEFKAFEWLSMTDYLKRHMQWSWKMFGPWGKARTKHDKDEYPGPAGCIDHIRLELVELEEKRNGLDDPIEWMDVIILGIDGFIRSGGEPSEFMMQLFAKQRKNFNRTWPDWKTSQRGKAITHTKGTHD